MVSIVRVTVINRPDAAADAIGILPRHAMKSIAAVIR